MNINLIDVDFDIPIYRYMRWEHLIGFYEDPSHGWVLINPQQWQDKYEHFIFKCEKFYNPRLNEYVGLGELAKQYFGQCWTLNEESSLQWQVNKPHSNNAEDNGPEQNGGEIWVKVRSTPRKLLEGMFYSSNNLVDNKYNILTYFIGKVKYLNDELIRNFEITDSEEIIDPKGMQQVLFLLLKRKQYQLENEVRLIMQVDSDFKTDRNTPFLVRRPIDKWYELIDEIVIDPWATETQVGDVKKYLDNLSIKECKRPISTWKSHLNDSPRNLVPSISI